jgi:omega-3 fatty acid desaturase (delta-15 desaturase)
MLGLLIGLGISHGFWFLFNYYIMPYIVFVVWLDLVTFLHHTEDDIPWYNGQDWYFLKGALSTIESAIMVSLIPSITKLVLTSPIIFLSLFPTIISRKQPRLSVPSYGDYYRLSKEPIFKSLWRSYRNCHFVSDQGSKIFYRKNARKQKLGLGLR